MLILLVWWINSSLDGRIHDEVLIDSMEDAQELLSNLKNDFPNGQRIGDFGIVEEWIGEEYYSIQPIMSNLRHIA